MRARVSILALVIRHAVASFLRPVPLSSVACPAPQDLPTLPHYGRISGGGGLNIKGVV